MTHTPDAYPWQIELASEPARMWDVVVIGAGPAGATAAAQLAQRGFDVLLLDRDRFPREKVCGDGLLPDAVHCLKRMGLFEQVSGAAYPIHSASVYSPSRIEMRIPGEYLALRRKTLDALVARNAVLQGARFCKGEVFDIRPQDDRVSSIHVNREYPLVIRARVCVIATGANIGLANRLGMVSELAPSARAVRCYYRSNLKMDRLVGSYDKAIAPGYGWIFPLGEGEYNLGVILFKRNGRSPAKPNLFEIFDVFLRSFPLARELVEQGIRISDPCTSVLRCGLMPCKPVNNCYVLAIGENISSTLPFIGGGVGKAMRTGEIAADIIGDALKRSDLDQVYRYYRVIEESLGHLYRGYKRAEKWLSVSWLNDFMARRVNKSAYLHNTLAEIIGGTVDPRAVFSIKGILNSFLR